MKPPRLEHLEGPISQKLQTPKPDPFGLLTPLVCLSSATLPLSTTPFRVFRVFRGSPIQSTGPREGRPPCRPPRCPTAPPLSCPSCVSWFPQPNPPAPGRDDLRVVRRVAPRRHPLRVPRVFRGLFNSTHMTNREGRPPCRPPLPLGAAPLSCPSCVSWFPQPNPHGQPGGTICVSSASPRS